MKRCFDPVIDKITTLIDQQLKEVKKARAPEIKVSSSDGSFNLTDRLQTLVLVGGFGDSQYLFKKIKVMCAKYGNLFPIVPHRPWSAIARGAGKLINSHDLLTQLLTVLALRGLTGELVEKRRCRRHYGTQFSRTFRPGIDKDEGDCYHDNFMDNKCKMGWMSWPINKVICPPDCMWPAVNI